MRVSVPAPVARLAGRLRRSPLAWMVTAELCLMLALGYFAWHLFAGRQHGPPAPGLAQAERDLHPTASPPPLHTPIPTATRPVRPGASPGPSAPDRLRDPALLRTQMDAWNRDQARWEAEEWALIKELTSAVRAYLEQMVVPAVLLAEEQAHGP